MNVPALEIFADEHAYISSGHAAKRQTARTEKKYNTTAAYISVPYRGSILYNSYKTLFNETFVFKAQKSRYTETLKDETTTSL